MSKNNNNRYRVFLKARDKTVNAMNVSLTAKLEKMVKSLVESGRYASASEVVRDGLRLVEEREQIREVKLKALKEAIQDGIDSGPAVPWDLEKFLKSARERRANRVSE